MCHAEAALEAWAEDEAAREMMGLLSGLEATLGRALVAYLGLWRSPSRALAWERALRLAREVLALEPDAARLAAALSQTVEQSPDMTRHASMALSASPYTAMRRRARS